ncbi:MAG: hypothetical protein ABI627_08615, partial [Polyangiaceae bacterium]
MDRIASGLILAEWCSALFGPIVLRYEIACALYVSSCEATSHQGGLPRLSRVRSRGDGEATSHLGSLP